MDKKYIKLISLLLVFILLTISCGVEKKETQDVVEDEKLTETTVLLDEDKSHDIVEPSINETEFFNQLAGGFFYTENSDDEYSKARIDAINIFNKQVIDVLEESYDLYDNGIKSYEDKLLFFIDDINQSKTEYNEDFQYIINHMMAYKSAINTLINKGNAYFETVENYDKNDINKALIDGEIFETTVVLYEKLDEYILFLESTSEYLASGIIEDFNVDNADVLRQQTAEIFSEDVLPDFIEIVKAYDQMSMMYVSINSADYFYTKSMAPEIINQLKTLEQSQEIEEITDKFIREMNNPSIYLIIIENEEKEETTFRMPFIKVVYAEEVVSNDRTTAMAIYNFIDEITMNYDMSEAEMNEALMRLILQKNNVKLEEKREKIKEIKNETPQLLIPETILAAVGETLMEMAGADPVYDFTVVGNTIIPVKLSEDQIEIQKELIKSRIHQEIKQEIINQEQRENMIEKLKNMQNSNEAIEANFLMMITGDLGGDIVYNKVISNFANVLGENKDKMKDNTFQTLNQLLQNDLEEILGSKKSDFVNKFLNASAGDIVNTFADWVNNSRNRKDIEINKNTLINLLDAMGFEHEGELEESINAIASNEEGMDGDVHSDEASDESINLEGKEEVLLDYLSYMLPHMDYVNQEDLKNVADQLNISKEEMYLYSMSILIIGTKNIVGGDDELSADEKRVTEGLNNFIDGGEKLDPWVRDYCFNVFYDLFNEKGDLDRWKDLSSEEKETLIYEALNSDNSDIADEVIETVEEENNNQVNEEVDKEDKNHFIFYRQDNGSINAEHTFSPYNAEYMRRDTTTYHNNGALESKGSILITIEASEGMIENYTTVIERAKNAKPGDFLPRPLAPARQNYFNIGLHERFDADGKILSSIEYNNEGSIILSKSWRYFDDGSVKEYREMDGNNTGSITHYTSEEYGGDKKYTDIYENNKSVKRINYD